jgi:RNA polymerase sigma-70 factor (ECF subfamily)
MKRTGYMDDITDDVLVDQAKEGDVDAFTALTCRYQEKIYNLVLGMTKNHLDADDLSQETFLQAFRSLKSFRQQASFYTWLYRVAVNLTLNHLKKGNREKDRQNMEIENVSEEVVLGSKVSSPDKQALRKELRQKLKAAIEGLPLIYRTSFILVELNGMSHSQASFVCRCSEKTVSWRIYQARKMLQNKLSPYLERGTP